MGCIICLLVTTTVSASFRELIAFECLWLLAESYVISMDPICSSCTGWQHLHKLSQALILQLLCQNEGNTAHYGEHAQEEATIPLCLL